MAALCAAGKVKSLLRPGVENYTVTEAVQQVTDAFKCRPLRNLLSFQQLQHGVAGKTLILNPTEQYATTFPKWTFGQHEIYVIDIRVSTGEGTASSQLPTTVFKMKNTRYPLTGRASRQFYSEMKLRFGYMPFSLRHFDNENSARRGVLECIKHGLVEPFTPHCESGSEFVAQFKFTFVVMPNCLIQFAGLPLDTSVYDSQYDTMGEKMIHKLVMPLDTQEDEEKKKSENVTSGTAADDVPV